MDKNAIQKQAAELAKELDNPKKFCKNLYAVFNSNVDKKAFANYQRIIPKMGKTFGIPLPVLRIIITELGKIDNWANCDNLACFGMEPIILSNTNEVLSLCERWVKEKTNGLDVLES